jgi:hypothetical protein
MVDQPDKHLLCNFSGLLAVADQVQREAIYRRVVGPVKLRKRVPIAVSKAVRQFAIAGIPHRFYDAYCRRWARTFQFFEKCRCGPPHRGVRLQVSLFAMLACLPVARAQTGTANATIVKIGAANLPSSVTLTMPGGTGTAGKNLTIPLTLSLLLGTTAPNSFQVDLLFDSTKLAFVSASGVTASAVSAGDVRLTSIAVASGVVGHVTFTLASSFGTVATLLGMASCRSADGLSNPLSTGCSAGSVGVLTCEVTGDSTVGVADVQLLVNEALGVVQAVHDMNGDGVVNVVDILIEVSAALGKGCVL